VSMTGKIVIRPVKNVLPMGLSIWILSGR